MQPRKSLLRNSLCETGLAASLITAHWDRKGLRVWTLLLRNVAMGCWFFPLRNFILRREYYSKAPNVEQVTAKLFWLKREKVTESQKSPISCPSEHCHPSHPERTPAPGILRPQFEHHWSWVTSALMFFQEFYSNFYFCDLQSITDDLTFHYT